MLRSTNDVNGMLMMNCFQRATNNNANNRGNRIRGPQSALTDFLASHNISADQIRRNFEARQQLADPAVDSPGARRENQSVPESVQHPTGSTNNGLRETPAQKRKRKREEEKAMKKIKQSKNTKRTARRTDDGSIEDGLPRLSHSSTPRAPGQLENCAVCSNRFTVTAYTKASPDGGLMCTKCAKEVDQDLEKEKPKKKPAQNRDRRRQMRAELLDGIVRRGAKSLVELCIRKIADQIHDVEDFGDLPRPLLDQLSRILSKRRAINSHTFNFFLHPEHEEVAIYDAADLKTEDFQKIFMVCPRIKSITLSNAGQFKDQVLQYITGNPALNLVHFCVEAANLIHDDVWRMFFAIKGRTLETIKLAWMDNFFDEDTFFALVRHCPKLSRVKLRRLWKLSGRAIEALAGLSQLKHLTLERAKVGVKDIQSAPIIKVLESVGRNLRTLCLDRFDQVDDDLLAAIHEHCRHLGKLRITTNSKFTDRAFVDLFTGWENLGLRDVNLRGCRDVDANKPVDNPHGRGLCSEGFTALMEHSGSSLERLQVTSCRHISHAAFFSVFDGYRTYPHLRFICVSFCDAVNDVILTGIFKSCPNIKEVQVFGCFKVDNPVVPRDVLLTGRANARDDITYQCDE